MPGASRRAGSSEPSGPRVGPEMRSTSRPGFRRSPRTEATVFSWAPPITRRVMTCVIRIRGEESGRRFETFNALAEVAGLVGAGSGVSQGKFEITDGGVGVALAHGDFAQAAIHVD